MRGEVKFISKPELAQQMLERAFAGGVPRRWVTGDSVYGASRTLRRWLEEQEQPYVLAVPPNESLWAGSIWEAGRVQTAAEFAGVSFRRKLSGDSQLEKDRKESGFTTGP